MFGKKSWMLLLAVVALWLGAACGGNEETVKIKLAMDWYPNANHAGLFVAQEKGYFADENLEVDLYTPVDPSTVNQTVAAGSDDFGINYQPDLLMARAQGVSVVSVAALVQHPLNSVQTLQASGITRPSELAGKKVGYPGIPLNELLLDTMLKADGVAGGLEEVELVNVGFNLAEMLINETVDACVGCYFSHESFLMENQGHPVNVMRMEKWGVPDFYELVLVTSEKMLEEKPEVVQRLVRALMKGYSDAAADPGAAVDILLAATKGEVDEAIERPGIQVIAPLWTEAGPAGWQTSEKWTNFADWMYTNGLVDDPIDAGAAFTNEFVEAAQK
ncbi:MAG: hypothetical protein BZY88_03460 [SAR202 cluster bacterium Io17-Chloro-G9]|nr:MAG: hypothetical protein BZY88_03460 [SAR202 cluster bacterium Io17-Chloro-G9]